MQGRLLSAYSQVNEEHDQPFKKVCQENGLGKTLANCIPQFGGRSSRENPFLDLMSQWPLNYRFY